MTIDSSLPMNILADKIVANFSRCKIYNYNNLKIWLDELFSLLFLGSFKQRNLTSREEFALALRCSMSSFTFYLLETGISSIKEADNICNILFHQIEASLYSLCILDAESFMIHDPAAKSLAEVISCYLGFKAIAYYRIAHNLHLQGVELLPRVFSEYAHEISGIDIHPAAVIGSNFVIDHGTGVVIGETTIIGDNVKIYQGVTLGAISVDKSGSFDKRHPTIEDNVVIYANATILGGSTVIGANSIIGGNVCIFESVNQNSKIVGKK
jgi:serine O-acetyltransferase